MSLKNWDNKTWLSSKDYINAFNNFLIRQIKLDKNSSILDIGCGRGKILGNITSKLRLIKKPTGIDIEQHKDRDRRIIFNKTDAISFLKRNRKKFDLICSNPPYVSSKEYKYLDESIKNYEPKLALISKDNGLGHLKHIAKEGRKYLKKNGTIFFEIGINQLKEVENILNCFGYSELLSYNDLNKVKRIVSAKWKN